MKYGIRILGTAAGVPTKFDGMWVKQYDPTFVHPAGYDGGILEVTDKQSDAMAFPSAPAAFEKWRQAFGTRPDGHLNRPLTAFTVEVLPL